MGKRGPAKLPHKMKKDRGTLNTTRDGKEPKPALGLVASESTPPDTLGEPGREFFKRVYKKAMDAGILASTDIDALAVASECYDVYRKLMSEGDYKQAGAWQDRWARWIKEFGFTPATRDSISQVPNETIDEENLFND
jgi:phage terminase small subunit